MTNEEAQIAATPDMPGMRTINFDKLVQEPDTQFGDRSVTKVWRIARLESVREEKITSETQCVKTPLGKVCADVPVSWWRDCDVNVYAKIGHPDLKTIEADVAACLQTALTAAAMALIASRSFKAASAVIAPVLIECLKAKGVKRAQEIELSVFERRDCPNWKRR